MRKSRRDSDDGFRARAPESCQRKRKKKIETENEKLLNPLKTTINFHFNGIAARDTELSESGRLCEKTDKKRGIKFFFYIECVSSPSSAAPSVMMCDCKGREKENGMVKCFLVATRVFSRTKAMSTGISER